MQPCADALMRSRVTTVFRRAEPKSSQRGAAAAEEWKSQGPRCKSLQVVPVSPQMPITVGRTAAGGGEHVGRQQTPAKPSSEKAGRVTSGLPSGAYRIAPGARPHTCTHQWSYGSNIFDCYVNYSTTVRPEESLHSVHIIGKIR